MRDKVMGFREQGTGNREQGTGNRNRPLLPAPKLPKHQEEGTSPN
ncbi:hypothetical protein [Moorena sp. SIO3A2]|nr:hypothetical protein [Moorena sp. SIO3A2]